MVFERDAVMLCFMFQLIPVITGHRTRKQERVRVVKHMLLERSLSQCLVAEVTCLMCLLLLNLRGCVMVCFLQALATCSVLSHVSDDVHLEFIAKLTTEWLPDKRFELLYRGSRDGMTAAAFHDKCDGKGPTLVLVAGQSEGQPVCVFGGYAGKSWERGSDNAFQSGTKIDARDSFLFTVLNSFGDGIVKMAVNERSEYAGRAMRCHACWGSLFGCGFGVRSSSWSPTAVFDEWSACWLSSGGTFGDPLGRGIKAFTGAGNFRPLEVEVWSVC
jgi:hypothetical protein